MGGGLLTAVKHELEPVLIHQGEDDAEIMIVEINNGSKS